MQVDVQNSGARDVLIKTVPFVFTWNASPAVPCCRACSWNPASGNPEEHMSMHHLGEPGQTRARNEALTCTTGMRTTEGHYMYWHNLNA